MPKNVMSLRLDDDVMDRIDRVRDGDRTRFITDAILVALAEREGTAVEPVRAEGSAKSLVKPPRQVPFGVVASPTRLAHRPQCTCMVCKPPKQAA